MENFEIPAEMRAFAEKSVEQARKAFEMFLAQANQAVTSFEGQAAAMRKSSEDVRQRAMSFAEQNIAASFDFAQRLLKAKDIEEVVSLQAEFMKAQMQVLAEQAKEIGESTSQAIQAAKPKF
jgi:phasin